MRGFSRSIRWASASNISVRARRREAAAGISAVSRAIALPKWGSAIAGRALLDGRAQVAANAMQQLRGFVGAQSQADQDSGLHVTIRLFEITGGVAFRAADDLADHG